MLPIYIPLTAVLAAWLGYEWTHSSYPRLISAEQPPLADRLRLQSFALSGLESDGVSTDPAWSPWDLRAESLPLILPTPSPSCLRLPPSWEAPSSRRIPPHPTAHAANWSSQLQPAAAFAAA